VRNIIEADHNKVIEDLIQYDFKDGLLVKFNERFEGLLVRLIKTRNFYEIIAMKDESDRLKLNCFDEIEKENSKKTSDLDNNPPHLHDGGTYETYKTKAVKNISIANILRGTTLIETKEDIDKVLDEIRIKLEEELDKNSKLKLI
jgi:hypothetical protein